MVEAGEKRQARRDGLERIPVEGEFGEAKRRYNLGLIMARLPETSESVIAMQFPVMNLAHCCGFLLPYF